MTVLIIARHGNTFESGETPRRVGARTDLPLTAKGREQAASIGKWLMANKRTPDVVYCSALQRTRQTAEIAIKETNFKQPAYPLDIFNEIDYGPDENKTDEDVIARIGAQSLKDWDEHAPVPPGWLADPEKITRDWHGFADQISQHDDNETVLVVTSNGIARFAPHITGDFEKFRAGHDLKIATGAVCVFIHENGKWRVDAWNVKP